MEIKIVSNGISIPDERNGQYVISYFGSISASIFPSRYNKEDNEYYGISLKINNDIYDINFENGGTVVINLNDYYDAPNAINALSQYLSIYTYHT